MSENKEEVSVGSDSEDCIKTEEELFLEEFKSIRYDSEIFTKFKDSTNYFIGPDFSCDMCEFTIIWVNSAARDDFIDFLKKSKEK